MNKNDLVTFVSDKTSLSKKDSAQAIEAVFDGITHALKKGQEASFVGFGTFKTAKRAAREGRNPRTGDTIKIPASTIARFKAGKALKESVN